jgi:hypothetical protein
LQISNFVAVWIQCRIYKKHGLVLALSNNLDSHTLKLIADPRLRSLTFDKSSHSILKSGRQLKAAMDLLNYTSLYLECQVETDSWQSTFLYVTLASVVVININSAIFQVSPVLNPVFSS